MSFIHIRNAMHPTAICLTGIAFAAFPASALAYVGPGAGLSIIGSVLAFFAAIIVAIFGFLFFPIRRMLRRRKQKAAQKLAANSPESAPDPSAAGNKQATAEDRKGNPVA